MQYILLLNCAKKGSRDTKSTRTWRFQIITPPRYTFSAINALIEHWLGQRSATAPVSSDRPLPHRRNQPKVKATAYRTPYAGDDGSPDSLANRLVSSGNRRTPETLYSPSAIIFDRPAPPFSTVVIGPTRTI